MLTKVPLMLPESVMRQRRGVSAVSAALSCVSVAWIREVIRGNSVESSWLRTLSWVSGQGWKLHGAPVQRNAAQRVQVARGLASDGEARSVRQVEHERHLGVGQGVVV